MANPAVNVISERRLLKRWFCFFRILIWWSGGGKPGEKFLDTCKHPPLHSRNHYVLMAGKGDIISSKISQEKKSVKVCAEIWLTEETERMAGIVNGMHLHPHTLNPK